MARYHEPAVLTETEWKTLSAVFAGSKFLSAIRLLQQSGNAAQSAFDLFHDGANQGEDGPNALLRMNGLSFRFAQTERPSKPSRDYRMFSIVRWPSQQSTTPPNMTKVRAAEIALLLQERRYKTTGTKAYMTELQDAAEELGITQDEMLEFCKVIFGRLAKRA